MGLFRRPLRIMHVLDRLALAGTECGVIKVVNHLDPERFAPSITCLRNCVPEAREQLRAGIPIFELHRREGIDWMLLPALIRVLRGNRIQVVHSHNWSTFAYVVVAARLAGIPVVIHGEHGRESQTSMVSAVRHSAERWLAGWTDRFTAVSRDLYEHIRLDWGVRTDRIYYIPNGVDLTRFGLPFQKETIRAQMGVGSAERLIGTVGWFRAVKDHDTLVRAFSLVRRQIPEARLVLVGLDPEDRFKERMASALPDWEQVRRDILFLGTRTDIPEILSVLEAYVNASLYEGMSNTILEAMASRKPVVATAVGGTPDLVRDGITGWLVPPRDPGRLADRIVSLLGDPAAGRRMGEKGREVIEREHSFQAMIDANADLYESTLALRMSKVRAADSAKVTASRTLRTLGFVSVSERLRPSDLTVVCYHRILPYGVKLRTPGRSMILSREVFESQIAAIARRHRVLTLEEARWHFANRRPFPHRAVLLTFDDGYADNHTYALPILKRYRVPATFFPVTGPIDGRGCLWWDDVGDALLFLHRARALSTEDAPVEIPGRIQTILSGMARSDDFPVALADRIVRVLERYDDGTRARVVRGLREWAGAHGAPLPSLMLTWDQIREMRGEGMTFGGHTLHHVPLDTLEDAAALREIEGCLLRIEQETGLRPDAFSYPKGRILHRVRGWLKASGVALAMTTEIGSNPEHADPLRLKRRDAGFLAVGDRFSESHMAVEMSGMLDWLAPVRGYDMA